MPVRLLNSSVLAWPDDKTVDSAVRRWAAEICHNDPAPMRVGYFGSYARGDWGVGSDLDLILVVEHSEAPFEIRSASWDVTGLPVPADLLVYTPQEWESVAASPGFGRTINQEVIWVYDKRSEPDDATCAS